MGNGVALGKGADDVAGGGAGLGDGHGVCGGGEEDEGEEGEEERELDGTHLVWREGLVVVGWVELFGEGGYDGGARASGSGMRWLGETASAGIEVTMECQEERAKSVWDVALECANVRVEWKR